MKPQTQYTKSGRINIAYQVFGSGPIDLVYIPGWVSNIDLMWECPELVHFLEELGKIARVILFDKRGTGLSDRVVELSTLEERMDDIRAVMDAVDSREAVLFGHSEGGSVSALFAATYPDRVISLITFGIFAKRRYSEDYPWAPTDEERQAVYDMIENSWGSGDMNLESLAPSKADDKAFMDWLATYFRSGASPSAAMVLTKMNTEVDIVEILGSIKVPTLIMQRTNDIDVKIEEGKFIADRIEGARFIEFEGDDHLFWAGNTGEVLDAMKSFILNQNRSRNYHEKLYTVLAGKLDIPESDVFKVQDLIRNYITEYRGAVIHLGKYSFSATFDGPSKATNCSLDLINATKKFSFKTKIGIHIKEGEVHKAHIMSSQTEQFFDSILQFAESNQVLISQTVKNLLSGAGLKFAPIRTVSNPFGEELLLFKVEDAFLALDEAELLTSETVPKGHSLLERVLYSIDTNIDKESFGVEVLSKEIGMSERQLQRKLKAITNKSPIQLISSVRLHRAKELMQKGENNIAEVSYLTGFASPSYFSKCFKEEFGITPSSFMKKSG